MISIIIYDSKETSVEDLFTVANTIRIQIIAKEGSKFIPLILPGYKKITMKDIYNGSKNTTMSEYIIWLFDIRDKDDKLINKHQILKDLYSIQEQLLGEIGIYDLQNYLEALVN